MRQSFPFNLYLTLEERAHPGPWLVYMDGEHIANAEDQPGMILHENTGFFARIALQ